MSEFTDHTSSTDATLPDWYLRSQADASKPSIGDSFRLFDRQCSTTVEVTHPLFSREAASIFTENEMGHMRYTLRGEAVSLKLIRHTHDGEPDTDIDVDLVPELYLGVLLSTEPGDTYQFRLKDTESGTLEQSIIKFFSGADGILKDLWTKSQLQLTQSGRGNDHVSIWCSLPLDTPEDDPLKAGLDLLQLETRIREETGAYAVSARDVLTASRSYGLYWRPLKLELGVGFEARPVSIKPKMSATMKGPQELYFDSPDTQATEEPWTPVSVLYKLRTNVVIP